MALVQHRPKGKVEQTMFRRAIMAKTIYLWEYGEYEYPCAGNFLPNLTAYLHEDEQARPAIIVVPGGGYAMVSPTEGEIVAKKFYHAGYQAFVLTYTTNMFRVKALEKQPMKDISRAVRRVSMHIRIALNSCLVQSRQRNSLYGHHSKSKCRPIHLLPFYGRL